MIKKQLIGLIILSLLQACSTTEPANLAPAYQTPGAKVSPLEVPPDLNEPSKSNYYEDAGSVRASEFQKVAPGGEGAAVLPQWDNMRIQRSGPVRSLIISDKDPSAVWSVLEDFWQDNGFAIEKNEPAVGYMETKWAENRNDIRQDFIRNILTKVGLGGAYSSGRRDKFKVNLERLDGGTIMTFKHETMVEVVSRRSDFTRWQRQAPDPELDELMLRRFMQSVGGREAVLRDRDVANRSGVFDAKRVQGGLLIAGDHKRNAYRLGLALDRVGLSVVSTNEAQGSFVVEPQEQVAPKKPGVIDKMLGTQPKPKKPKPRYLVKIAPLSDGSGDRVDFLDLSGRPAHPAVANRYLDLIWKELR